MSAQRTEPRPWQDWATYALALWLAVSPWLTDYAAHDVATANAAVCGLALAVVAHLGCTCERMSCEWLNLGGGLWLVVAPLALGSFITFLSAWALGSVARSAGSGIGWARVISSQTSLLRYAPRMFTGIVHAVGRIVRLEPLEIDCGDLDVSDVAVGDSIAVQGVCLTVTALTGKGFTADVSGETQRVTSGLDRVGAAVNLEKSLALGERLGGHLVAGHVDGVGEVLGLKEGVLRVRAPDGLARYVARKGSICIDGVSLTVNRVEQDDFEVQLIPHTLEVTTLGSLRAGAKVNLEADLIARYVERLLEASR